MAGVVEDLTGSFDELFGAHRKGPYPDRPEDSALLLADGSLTWEALHFGRPNRLSVLASDIGAGKSALAVQLVADLARRGEKCLYLNAEVNNQTSDFASDPMVDVLTVTLDQLAESRDTRRQLVTLGEDYAAVVIDSAPVGRPAELTAAVDLATRLRWDTEASVLVTSQALQVSPSSSRALDDIPSALAEHADAVAFLKRADTLASLAYLKMRHAMLPGTLALTWHADHQLFST